MKHTWTTDTASSPSATPTAAPREGQPTVRAVQPVLPRLFYTRVEMNAKLISVKENTCVRPVIESGLLEELIDQFCDLLRRVLMTVVANAL